jgi:hypothetical protein
LKISGRMPPSWAADDPGAGKKIMAGLFIKELIVRGDLHRCPVGLRVVARTTVVTHGEYASAYSVPGAPDLVEAVPLAVVPKMLRAQCV